MNFAMQNQLQKTRGQTRTFDPGHPFELPVEKLCEIDRPKLPAGHLEDGHFMKCFDEKTQRPCFDVETCDAETHFTSGIAAAKP